MLSYLLGFSFAVMGACLITSIIAGIVLFGFSWRRVNDAFQHPLLKAKPFKGYPFSIQAAIFLDYFLRLMFTDFRRPAVVANANRMLAHVDPKTLPLGVRWPLAGFWGGCLLGIVAMVTVWILLLVGV